MTLYGGKTLEELEALANAANRSVYESLAFVAASRAAIPALIARIRELEKPKVGAMSYSSNGDDP
jgi:hypothetical protein